MNIQNIVFLLFALIAATSCKNGSGSSQDEFVSDLEEANFIVSDTLVFDLDDSLVVNDQTQIQYFPDKQSIAILDNNFNRLIFYNLNQSSPSFVKQLKSFNEKKSKKIHGFVYDDKKNIVYYKQNFNEGSGLISYDFNTNLHEIFFLKKRPNIYESRTAPDPFIANTSPMHYFDSTLIFSGLLLGEDPEYRDNTRKTFGRIDFKTNNVKYFSTYPEEYYKKNWGGEAYRFIYSCRFKNDEILISFPASHLMYILHNDSLLKMNGANPLRKPEILPMKMDRKRFQKRKSKQMTLDFYTQNYSYHGVFYIPGQKRIVRVLELPLKEKVKLNSRYNKPAMLLVFDENFTFLKEVALPDYLSRHNYFITEKGIYFYNKSNENENKAQYFLFSDF